VFRWPELVAAENCCRLRAVRQKTSITSSSAVNNATGIGRRRSKGLGAAGGTAALRAVVVTVTVAVPAPLSEFGLTEQYVAVAGTEQLSATADEKLFSAAIEMALVNVAVVPAVTVTLVVPPGAIVKSGSPVTVRLNALDVPAGGGSTTYAEYVPGFPMDNGTENWVGVLVAPG
jgi:hypothetical protein